ncbi:MAG: indolepyruvate oxidoreductase subunit beta [Desulfurococcaceae archaeon]
MKITNILIASVGGQGGLTLARVLAVAATLEGLQVRTGETLGMAQRYGSVVSYVRIGEEVYSPIFSPGDADYLLGLELYETLRNIHYLKPGGKLIAANEYRPPYSVSFNTPESSRDDVIQRLKSLAPGALIVPARKTAVESGNPRALNMVVLGAFIKMSGILKTSNVEEAIGLVISKRAIKPSLLAFRKGLELI